MIVIVMGVVGAGKTTVGQLLAQELGWQFADADDFHPLANIEKIRRGIPLTDDDRSPWLDRLREFLLDCVTRQCNLVLACSALKRSYRQELQVGPELGPDALLLVNLSGRGDKDVATASRWLGHLPGEAGDGS